MPCLQLVDLRAGYGNIRVLRDVSLDVEDGEIVAIVGANGAGKTTTLSTIAGLVRPSGGRVVFEDKDISRLAPHRIAQLGLALCPEGRHIFENLTVRENLEIGSFLRRDAAEVRRDRDHLYQIFPVLKERSRQNAGTLSGGEQQMLAIGRALMARPRLLMLDEPSLGLAPMLVREIFNIIARINDEGTTVLIVEQNARMALSVADRAYVLENGRITLSGSAERLLADEEIVRSYLGPL
jgi:branched-chain amino acid transport system ATP-binding protein